MIGTPGRLEELLQKKTDQINLAKSIKQLVGLFTKLAILIFQ